MPRCCASLSSRAAVSWPNRIFSVAIIPTSAWDVTEPTIPRRKSKRRLIDWNRRAPRSRSVVGRQLDPRQQPAFRGAARSWTSPRDVATSCARRFANILLTDGVPRHGIPGRNGPQLNIKRDNAEDCGPGDRLLRRWKRLSAFLNRAPRFESGQGYLQDPAPVRVHLSRRRSHCHERTRRPGTIRCIEACAIRPVLRSGAHDVAAGRLRRRSDARRRR